MRIQDKGELKEYETIPKRTLYIAVYQMPSGTMHSISNENKEVLIGQLRNMDVVSRVKIFEVKED